MEKGLGITADPQQQDRRAGEQAQQHEDEARQAAEEQQREALRRRREREQDEAWRAAEMEAARVRGAPDESEEKRAPTEPRERVADRAKPTEGLRTSSSPPIFQKRWIALFGGVAVVAAAGVVVWQELGKESPPTPSPPLAAGDTTKPSIAPPSTEPAVKPDQPEVTTRPAATPTKDQPGQTFRDCDGCPEMVVVPAGTFTMGSPATEPERYEDESPQHRVTIGPFAMGKTEVTFAQWNACVTAGGCNGYKPPDEGWGRWSRPVINVSWKGAKAYVSWLSQHTGKPHRLPSEAEWEYATRAGATTPYAFGNAITPKNANYGSNVGKTTEVGAYPPNAWGLYDMHGNVWEWVEDVWHNGYEDAPADGSAWTDGEGENSSRNRVSRGGSWVNDPGGLRSANRNGSHPLDRLNGLGFRVARTLD